MTYSIVHKNESQEIAVTFDHQNVAYVLLNVYTKY